MARARGIKPGFFRNADLAELAVESRLLFIGLWTLADREGRLKDRPKQIKMEIFPADNLDCDALLSELASTGMLVRYEVDGARYLQIKNFSKHQNPHRDEQASTIPAQGSSGTNETPAEPTHHATTMQAPYNHDASTMLPLLTPDSCILTPDSRLLIPDSLTGEGLQAEPATPKPPTRGSRKCPKNFEVSDELAQWAQTECPGVDVDRATKKFQDHTFKTALTDWPATWRNWIRTDFERLPTRAPPRETAYERGRRERVAEFCPSLARRQPGADFHNTTFEVENVTLLASR